MNLKDEMLIVKVGKQSEQNKWAMALTVGTVISSNIVGGLIVGYWLDRWLGTQPWLLLAGILLGTGGAFLGVYRILSHLD